MVKDSFGKSPTPLSSYDKAGLSKEFDSERLVGVQSGALGFIRQAGMDITGQNLNFDSNDI